MMAFSKVFVLSSSTLLLFRKRRHHSLARCRRSSLDQLRGYAEQGHSNLLKLRTLYYVKSGLLGCEEVKAMNESLRIRADDRRVVVCFRGRDRRRGIKQGGKDNQGLVYHGEHCLKPRGDGPPSLTKCGYWSCER